MLPAIEEEASIPLASGAGDAEAVAASVLVSSFRARPLAREGEWSVYGIGSRAKLRVWGLWNPKGYRRLPLKVRMRVLSDEGRAAVLHLQLLNDEGPYLFRLPALEPAYRRAYREIVERLQLVLQPH